jgi:TRAP-type C4-dicarboxylate transport system substrate-binding protein
MIKGLLTACLLSLSLAGAAADAAVTLKIATIAPDGTRWMQELRKAGDEIARRTDNAVKLRFFPGGIMGNDKSVLRKIRVGQLQGGVIVSGGLTDIYPDIVLYNIPFLFRSYDQADYVRQRLDPVLIEGLARNGFVSFGLSEGGFAYLMSKTPIRSVDQLQSHKVWVPADDPLSRIVFDTIDIAPIPLPLTDVLTGLQTGLIDTVASSPIGAIALQWQTQVKYLVNEPLVYLYATLIIDNKAYGRIDTANQAIVREELEKVFRSLDQQTRKDDAEAIKALKAQGIEFLEPTAASRQREAEIRAKAEQLLEQRKVLSPELVQRVDQMLNEERQPATAHD